ncbi:hypothetical protein [Sorangium cellulosum]|uniref:hypothetical protein n=1 Tax=Sorangium cellulosum TaxID=56 RepID=UPI0010122338|nr:hypothetical protein [Sorangium cellulosum]
MSFVTTVRLLRSPGGLLRSPGGLLRSPVAVSGAFLPSGSPSSVPSSCYPSIGLVALHTGVTVRDSEIETSDGGQGGDGGEP